MKNALFVLLLASGVAWGQAKGAAPQAGQGGQPQPQATRLRPSPELSSLLRTFSGAWQVSEKIEATELTQAGARTGTARFRPGPGVSLMEMYRANGSAGELRWLGVFWWDTKTKTYRVFTCVNADGCNDRGTAKWEGPKLVNTWERTVKGKKVVFRDTFTDLSPAAFTLVAEAAINGGPMKTLVTSKYVQQTPARNQ